MASPAHARATAEPDGLVVESYHAMVVPIGDPGSYGDLASSNGQTSQRVPLTRCGLFNEPEMLRL